MGHCITTNPLRCAFDNLCEWSTYDFYRTMMQELSNDEASGNLELAKRAGGGNGKKRTALEFFTVEDESDKAC